MWMNEHPLDLCFDPGVRVNKPSGFEEPACVPIPEGHFLMGCEAGRDEEKPVHRVWVDAFEMAALQVTRREYELFIRATGRPAPAYWNSPEFSDPDQPVVAPSWFDAAAYCEWLSALTGRGYRLPTEAEWEGAARGGAEGRLYTWGDEPPHERQEYQRRWSGQIDRPLAVGQESPNAFGIYDIGENVHEWCSDWYSKAYYSASPERNPQGPERGNDDNYPPRRASRGGSWRHQIKVSRCAARSSIPPQFQYADYGFRVVRDVQPL